MSAFWDGGRGGDEGITVFLTKRPRASVKRIGRMVKVYKNESRQSTNPNTMICGKTVSLSQRVVY